jgi:hypothetical protein
MLLYKKYCTTKALKIQYISHILMAKLPYKEFISVQRLIATKFNKLKTYQNVFVGFSMPAAHTVSGNCHSSSR